MGKMSNREVKKKRIFPRRKLRPNAPPPFGAEVTIQNLTLPLPVKIRWTHLGTETNL